MTVPQLESVEDRGSGYHLTRKYSVALIGSLPYS